MFAAGDPLPLLRAVFPGQAGELVGLAALSARLQSAPALRWRCARLALTPPLAPSPNLRDGCCDCGCDSPPAWSTQAEPPRDRKAMVALGGAGHFLLYLDLHGACSGQTVSVRKIVVHPQGLLAAEARRRRLKSAAVSSLDAALLWPQQGGCLHALVTDTLCGVPESDVVRLPSGDSLITTGLQPETFLGVAAALDAASGTAYCMGRDCSLSALRLTDRTWLALPALRRPASSSGGSGSDASGGGSSSASGGGGNGGGEGGSNNSSGGGTGSRLHPIAVRVHEAKLLALCRSHALAGVQQLQVWTLDLPAVEGGEWELLHGSCVCLPHYEQGFDLAAAPFQDTRWLVMLQPKQARRSKCVRTSWLASDADTNCRPCQRVDAERFVLSFDLCSGAWSSPQRSTPADADSVVLRPGQRAGKHPQLCCGAAYFQQQAEELRGRGLAAAAEAAAAAAAEAARDTAGAGGAEAPQQQQQQGGQQQPQGGHQGQEQAHVALLVDREDYVVAMWQEWGPPLPPLRLGEIAAPEGLPYSLRQAQAVRAVAAAGVAEEGAAEAAAGRAGSTSAVLLCLAADPCLPSIACPLAAAQQCGELARLLELLGEEEEAAPAVSAVPTGADGSCREAASSTGLTCQRRLALAGVRPEEHAALEQLVRCLEGQTHTGLLEATQLLDVARLADLLDAPALLAECLAAFECMAPGPELFAPLMALAEARQYHSGLQRLQAFYRRALVPHLLQGGEALLRWALHGLQAGVDAILQVCTEVAATWLPRHPGLWLGSPADDLEALGFPEWQAAMLLQPEQLRPLLLAMLKHAQRMLDGTAVAGHLQQQGAASGGGAHSGGSSSGSGRQQKKKPRIAASVPGGPFQSAAVRPRPDPAAQRQLPMPQLGQAVRRALEQLVRSLPGHQAQLRQQRTALAFAEAEARARRQWLYLQ